MICKSVRVDARLRQGPRYMRTNDNIAAILLYRACSNARGREYTCSRWSLATKTRGIEESVLKEAKLMDPALGTLGKA